MDSFKAVPLVNSAMLQQYRGRTVKIVGRVQKREGNTLQIQAADQGLVEVAINNTSGVGDNVATFIEVTGKVDDHAERIRAFSCVMLGDSLDLNLVEECTQLQKRFPELFPGAAQM